MIFENIIGNEKNKELLKIITTQLPSLIIPY